MLELGGTEFWGELNRLFYEKCPELRQIDCQTCGQAYRDYDNCPECGQSRYKQLGVEPPRPLPRFPVAQKM